MNINKIKEKAHQPLTYGWLWNMYIGELLVTAVICGGMAVIGAYEKSKEAKAKAKADDYEVKLDLEDIDEEEKD